MAQQEPDKELARLPGSVLRWIHKAEPVFAKQNLKVENYTVVVVEEGNTVTVYVTSNPTLGSRGSTGKYPGYEVTFSKKTGKIMSAHYSR